MTQQEKKDCRRCQGTGMRNTGVVHIGVPGLCYACDGAGVLVLVSADIQRAAQAASIVTHRREVEETAAYEKARHARRVAKHRTREELDAYRATRGASPVTDAGWAAVLARHARQDERHAARLAELRQVWRGASDVKPVTRARWVSCHEAARLARLATK
jgi:hypothetical protein